MTIKEIEKYAKSVGLCGEFGDPFIGSLYMSFGEPHKYTVLYYPGDKRKRKIYRIVLRKIPCFSMVI